MWLQLFFHTPGFKQASQPPKPKDPEVRTLKINKLKIDAIICINLPLTSDLVYLWNDCPHSLSEQSKFIAWGSLRGWGSGVVCEILLRQKLSNRNVIILLKLRRMSSWLLCDQPGTERTELLFRGAGHKQLSLKYTGVITALRERAHDTVEWQRLLKQKTGKRPKPRDL